MRPCFSSLQVSLYAKMTILSISIPSSARRSVFGGSSAPGTAVLPTPTPGTTFPPKNSLLQPPAPIPPGLSSRPGMAENGLQGLSNQSSLEDLLAALKTRCATASLACESQYSTSADTLMCLYISHTEMLKIVRQFSDSFARLFSERRTCDSQLHLPHLSRRPIKQSPTA